MIHQEYLLGYGALGDFGRFFPVAPLACRRGQRVAARTARGLELATVLGEARPGHAQFLPNTTVGQLLRLATPDDEETWRRRRDEARRLFEEARLLAASLRLPLEIIDAEALLDGEHAVVHYLHWADCDTRPFVSRLSRAIDAHITLFDLGGAGVPGGDLKDEHEHGCGRPGCGSESGGCGTAGACSTCGLKNLPDLKKYFAGLREQMQATGQAGR
jgi:cell fate regulator YaaT (PSP1 superfamily)